MKATFSTIGQILAGLAVSALAGLIAMVVWSVVWFLIDVFSELNGSVGASNQNLLTVFFVVAGIGATLTVGVQVAEATRTSRARARAASDAAAERSRATVESIANTRRQAIHLAGTSVELFATMPGWLSSAAQWYGQAQTRFADGAFSPFWESIETSYQQLGGYRDAADQIATNAQAYSDRVSELAKLGDPDAPGLGAFPVQLDAKMVAMQHAELIGKLDRLVYEAQKVPTFAIIWEQRRNTDAMISGFRSLGEAVRGMTASVNRSIADLGSALSSSNKEVARSLIAMRAENSFAAVRQLEETRALTVRATQIRDTMYHPELARWL